MSRVTNHLEMSAAELPPATVGRGTGMTLKEINQRLDVFMEAHHMPSHQWQTLEQKVRAGSRTQQGVDRRGKDYK